MSGSEYLLFRGWLVLYNIDKENEKKMVGTRSKKQVFHSFVF